MSSLPELAAVESFEYREPGGADGKATSRSKAALRLRRDLPAEKHRNNWK